MPAVPPTNICHVIYEPGITLCPIYYILCYVDRLAILSDSAGRWSRRRGACPRYGDHRRPILSLIATRFSRVTRKAAFQTLCSFGSGFEIKIYSQFLVYKIISASMDNRNLRWARVESNKCFIRFTRFTKLYAELCELY